MTCTVLVLVMNNVPSTNTSITLLMYTKWTNKFIAWDKDLIKTPARTQQKVSGIWIFEYFPVKLLFSEYFWFGLVLNCINKPNSEKEKRKKNNISRGLKTYLGKKSLLSFFGQKLDEGKRCINLCYVHAEITQKLTRVLSRWLFT